MRRVPDVRTLTTDEDAGVFHNKGLIAVRFFGGGPRLELTEALGVRSSLFLKFFWRRRAEVSKYVILNLNCFW